MNFLNFAVVLTILNKIGEKEMTLKFLKCSTKLVKVVTKVIVQVDRCPNEQATRRDFKSKEPLNILKPGWNNLPNKLKEILEGRNGRKNNPSKEIHLNQAVWLEGG